MRKIVLMAGLALGFAIPSTAQASPHMTWAEASAAIATLSDGRKYEVARPVAPWAEFGNLRFIPGDFDRLGKRAALMDVLVSKRPTDGYPEWVVMDMLVRERPRSGRIIVRAVL